MALIMVFACAHAREGYAQDESMRFESLSFEQGVGSNWVFQVMEDSESYLWFAGFSGLSRHDGLHSTHYMHDPHDPASIGDNRVFRILQLSDGRLSLSTSGGGLSIFDPYSQRFFNYTQRTHPKLPSHFICGGAEVSADELLYVMGRPRSLVLFNLRDSFPDFEEIPLEWTSQHLHFRENKSKDLLEDPKHKGVYWIVGNFRLYRFDSKSRELHMEREFERLLTHNYYFELINAVTWLDEDHLLLNIREFGFHRYNVRNGELTFLLEDPTENPEDCVSIYPSREGFFWVGSTEGKLFRFYPYEPRIEQVTLSGDTPNGSWIEGIYESPRGELYLGTNGEGVLKYHPSRNRFRVLLPEWSENYLHQGILHPYLPYYYVNGRVSSRYLHFFDLDAGSYMPLDGPELSSVEKGNFFLGPDRQVLFNNREALYRIHADGRSYGPFEDRRFAIPNELPGPIYRVEYLPGSGLLLQGRAYLCWIEPNRPAVVQELSDWNPFDHTWMSARMWEGELLILSAERLIRFDPVNKKYAIIPFASAFWERERKSMRALLNAAGELYIPSALRGLLKVKIERDSLHVTEQITAPSPLLSNHIYSAVQDSSGYFWFSTNHGYERFDPLERRSFRFGYRQNLPRLYRDNPVCINDQGIIASHGYRDLVWSGMEDLLRCERRTRLRVHFFSVDGEEKRVDLYSEVPPSFELDPHQRLFEIAWSHLGASSPDYYEMSYRLDGLEEEWQPAFDTYRVRYSGVPPGEYTFRIRVRSITDGALLQEAAYSIHVASPFWQKTWFRLAIILAVVILVLFFLRQRTQAIRHEQQLITAYNKQLAELEMQYLRAQMNPHFMFNSLNSIKHFILLNEREKAVEYLGRFAQLIRSILQSSSNRYIPLSEELKTLKIYIELEQARFSGGFDYDISLDPAITAEETFLQPLIFQPFVENAIWHGLMHKKGDRKLNIHLNSREGMLVCEIEDNGIGREASSKLKTTSSTRQSMGLSIALKRIRSQDSSARVEVEDLRADDGRALGTRVSIFVPLRTSHNNQNHE